MKESPIQRAVVAKLRKALGGKWEITSPSPYDNSGRPDVNGCVQGICVKLEVKQLRKHPRADQIAELTAWANAGAITAVVRSVDDCDEIIERILDRIEC